MTNRWKVILSGILVALGFKHKTSAQEILQIKDPVHLTRYINFPSQFVTERNLDIWLPQSYNVNADQKYPVIYLQDGQNLFDPNVSYHSNPLSCDQALNRLVAEKKIKECIVVGIWNTDYRYREYNPTKPFEALDKKYKRRIRREYNGKPLSDEYLKFIVFELKPYIDSAYRTLSSVQNTFIGGASMGGLISFYALMEYPDVFGGAMCMSTHWPLSVMFDNKHFFKGMMQYVPDKMPILKDKKIYFDHGTENLDSWYAPYQKQIDQIFELYHKDSVNYKSLVFPEASHSELDWRKRLDIPLEFLLK